MFIAALHYFWALQGQELSGWLSSAHCLRPGTEQATKQSCCVVLGLAYNFATIFLGSQLDQIELLLLSC